MSNPWNGKVILEAFWWDCWNASYPNDWYSYLAKLAPRLKNLGLDGIWIPPPCKGSSPAENNMGYFPFDYYDLGQKDQQGSVNTRFGTLDSLLRLVAIAHANGLEVYPDIVLDHCDGGSMDNSSPTDIGTALRVFTTAVLPQRVGGPSRGLIFILTRSTGFCPVIGPSPFLDRISATRDDAAIVETPTAIPICGPARATGLSGLPSRLEWMDLGSTM
jgi:hypothetical protein